MPTLNRPWRIALIVTASILAGLVVSSVVLYFVFSKRVGNSVKEAIGTYLRSKVRESVAEASQGKVQVDLQGFDYEFFTGVVRVDSISVGFADTTSSVGSIISVSIAHMEATGVFPWDVLNGGGLSLGTITIDRPVIYQKSWDSVIAGESPSEPDTALFHLPHVPDVDSLLNALSVGMLPQDIAPLTIAGLQIRNATVVREIHRHPSDSLNNTQSTTSGINITIRDINLGQGEQLSSQVFTSVVISVGTLDRHIADGRSQYVSGFKVIVDNRDSSMTVDTVRYRTPFDYSFHVAGIQFSFARKQITIDSVSIGPTLTDQKYFGKQTFNNDRFRFNISHLALANIDFAALSRGEALHVRKIQLEGVEADILSNKRLRDAPSTGAPKMPNALFRTLPFRLEVDTIHVRNAAIVYGERKHNSSTPALLRFSNMTVRITGATNVPSIQVRNPLTIYAKGTFMEQAPMEATLRIPLDKEQYRLEAEGSMGKLDITRLNSFLPIAENIRIDDGLASKASFSFVVQGRTASGYVDAYYTDLKVQLLDAETKETDFLKSVISFAANWLVVRNDNPPGEDHVVGRISYTLPADAAIMQTLWFPIRAGLGDAAGF